MNIEFTDRKQIGVIGEDTALTYLRRSGFTLLTRNFSRKTGEIDLVVKKKGTIHFVEVKTFLVDEFPDPSSDTHDPAMNIHGQKIKRIGRTAEWYVANEGWEGEWQIDAVLVWIRKRDAMAEVRYIPQIV